MDIILNWDGGGERIGEIFLGEDADPILNTLDPTPMIMASRGEIDRPIIEDIAKIHRELFGFNVEVEFHLLHRIVETKCHFLQRELEHLQNSLFKRLEVCLRR